MITPYLSLWDPPLDMPLLRRDEVHVWVARLDCAEDALHRFRGYLSTAESRRADRFLHVTPRRRFIAARGQLRCLLGRYLGCAPGHLTLCEGRYGKPYLCDLFSVPVKPSFNLTHCGDLALYAFSAERDVGIDLERHDRSIDILAAGRYFLTRAEQSRLDLLPEPERQRAYLEHWVRKEAYVKVRGHGLRLDPTSFSVSGDGVGLTHPQPIARLESQSRVWTLADLDVGKSHAASLAVAGDGWRILTGDRVVRSDRPRRLSVAGWAETSTDLEREF